MIFLLEDTPTALDTVVTQLQNILNTDALFTNLGVLLPVVSGLVIFAFTYRIIKRMISGAPKGKVRV